MIFTQETLALAQSLTAHRVEINPIETSYDETALHIGDDCSVFVNTWSGEYTLEVRERLFAFGTIEAAIQAADAYETVMVAIRDAAKASREKVKA